MVESKIIKQIQHGNIRLKSLPTSHSVEPHQQIREKNKNVSKDLLLLDLSLSQHISGNLNKLKKNKSVRSTDSLVDNPEVSSEELREYMKEQVMINVKLKELQKRQESLREEKEERENRKRTNEEEAKMSLIQEQDFEKRKRQLEKRHNINQRLQKLEQNKKCRTENFRRSVAQSLPVLPKYKLMRYKFDVEEINFEDEQSERRRRIQYEKEQEEGPDLIKRHVFKYDKFLKERQTRQGNPSQKELTHSQLVQIEKNFNKIGPNPDKVTELKEKIERVNHYQDKVIEKRMNMKLDGSIGKELEAIKDKSKFPFKYHYLKLKKNLTDLEIYEHFNFFNFNSDPNQIGKAYLSQLKIINEIKRNNKITKYQKSFNTEPYIHKSTHQINNHPSYQQSNNFEPLVKASSEKEKLAKLLYEESKQIKESVGNLNRYEKSIKIESSEDEALINRMKAKLKGLKIE